MPRYVTKEGKKYITLRLDPVLVQKLDTECLVRGVSRTFLTEWAIRKLLEEETDV